MNYPDYLSLKQTLFQKKPDTPSTADSVVQSVLNNCRPVSTHKRNRESIFKNFGSINKIGTLAGSSTTSTTIMATVNEYKMPNCPPDLSGLMMKNIYTNKTLPSHPNQISSNAKTKEGNLATFQSKKYHKVRDCFISLEQDSLEQDDQDEDSLDKSSTIAIDDMGSQIFRQRIAEDQQSIVPPRQVRSVPINRYEPIQVRQSSFPIVSNSSKSPQKKTRKISRPNKTANRNETMSQKCDSSSSNMKSNKINPKLTNIQISNHSMLITNVINKSPLEHRNSVQSSSSSGTDSGQSATSIPNAQVQCDTNGCSIPKIKCKDKRLESSNLKSTNQRIGKSIEGEILTNPDGKQINGSSLTANQISFDPARPPIKAPLNFLVPPDETAENLEQKTGELNIPGLVVKEDDLLANVSFGVRERLRSWRHDLDIRTKKVKQHIVTTTLDQEDELESEASNVEKSNGDKQAKADDGQVPAKEAELESTTKCLKERLRERLVFPEYFNDQSRLYLAWLSVVSVAFLYNAYSIPLRATFPYQKPSNLGVWLFFDYVCDVIYIIDMVVFKPRVMFIKNGMAITDKTLMKRYYLFGKTFKMDLLSLVPTDLFYAIPGLRWNPLLRLNRLLRLKTYQDVFKGLDSMVQNPYILRVTRMLTYMIYLIHCNSCIYYAFSAWEGLNSNPWVYSGKGVAYIRCFYFMLKVATSIGNNQSPTNVFEVLYMTYSWMLGVFVFALLLGQIRDIVATASKAQDHYRQTIDSALQDMKAMKLPQQLQEKVLMWFTHTWEEQKTFNEKSLTDKLPVKLQTDLALSVHYDTLSKVELFKDCEPGLIRDLVLKLKAVLFLPGDYVCRKGEVGKEMYIVSKGQVQVVGGKPEIVFVTLSEGAVFGEIALLSVGAGNRRTADVKAKGFSTLFILEKDDLNEVIEDYPEAQKIMKRKAKQMMKNSKTRSGGEDKEAQIDLEKEAAKVQANRTPKMLETVVAAMQPGKETTLILKNLLKNYQK